MTWSLLVERVRDMVVLGVTNGTCSFDCGIEAVEALFDMYGKYYTPCQ